MRSSVCVLTFLLLAPVAAPVAAPVVAQDKLVTVDKDKREIRVACQALRVDIPLEFFCVVSGTSDHETVLRTKARPADIHAALLGLGVEPGTPLRNVPGTRRFLPPGGPPVRVEAEWQQDGRTVRRRAGRLMRDVKTHAPMPDGPFVFVGSKFLDDGRYAADVTGQIVSVVNFENTVLDVPAVVSNANETLEWEVDPDAAPAAGTPVTMILTVIGDDLTSRPATAPAPEIPSPAVVITVSKQGKIELNNAPVEPSDLAAAVRRAAGSADPAVRLSAPVGAPIDALGRTFGQLAAAGLGNVTFERPPTDPPPASPNLYEQDPIQILVGDGGSKVSVTVDGRSTDYSLTQFVTAMQEQVAKKDVDLTRPIFVRPRNSGPDSKRIDVAAPVAALYVLGYTRVGGEYALVAKPADVEPPSTKPSADARLAELRHEWERRVLPRGAALREAAQTHYAVMQAYQDEINRKLDEVETLRRAMDDLQARYNALTTPQPIPATGPSSDE